MSKGSKRRLHKTIQRDHQHVWGDLEKPAQKTEPKKPWLNMTDGEIDAQYWQIGKADRTRMKKETAQQRLRERVNAVLAAEVTND
jgi:hypothetical protein